MTDMNRYSIFVFAAAPNYNVYLFFYMVKYIVT